jgi:phosphohistidine phosphatase
MDLADRIQVESGLYGATDDELLFRLMDIDDVVSSVLVVGHNPGLQDLALVLAGGDPELVTRLAEKFPTGALADVVLDRELWSQLSPKTAHLASLTIPRDLPG